jgi:hypothetical protein
MQLAFSKKFTGAKNAFRRRVPQCGLYLYVAFCLAGTTCGLENDPNADLKSPISLVHEIALKRNLAVNFEVVSEKGPPHMRTFMTKCTVGDKVTTGEGNGKKVCWTGLWLYSSITRLIKVKTEKIT